MYPVPVGCCSSEANSPAPMPQVDPVGNAERRSHTVEADTARAPAATARTVSPAITKARFPIIVTIALLTANRPRMRIHSADGGGIASADVWGRMLSVVSVNARPG